MSEDIKLENILENVKVHKPLTRDLSQMEIDEDLKKVNEIYQDNGTETALKEIYQSMKAKNPDAICPSCGGKPVKDKVCKVCGAGHYVKDSEIIETLTEEVTDKLLIPKKYKTERFLSSKLVADWQDKMFDERDKKVLSNYVKLLDSILGRINKGQLEKSSYFISAPSGFGKNYFVYTAIQLAQARGLKVFPYLDLIEVNQLLDVYERRSYYEQKHLDLSVIEEIGYTPTDLYTSELCILKTPRQYSDGYFFAFKTMLQIIDRRSKRDLPTIIMSNDYINFFTARDKFNEVAGIVSYNNPSVKNLQVYEVKYRHKDKQEITNGLE